MTIKKLSFTDAAFEMERICDQLEEVEDIGVLIQHVFNNAQEDLKDSIDRRIKFLRYAESQVTMAKQMRDQWASRAERFEKTIEYLKKNTIDVMKANPGLPYKGNIGGFKVYKNSVPTLILEHEGLGLPMEYWKLPPPILDKAKIKEDLKKDIALEGASLEYGEHVRINLNI